MANDQLEPAGIYLGTRSGKLFGSANGGNSWELILEGLPPIVCVKAGMVDEVGSVRRPVPVRKERKETRAKQTAKSRRKAA
jgi:hypothetical protein